MALPKSSECVITGLGVVSPLGLDIESFADAIFAGRSGIRRLGHYDASRFPVTFGGEIVDFDPKRHVRPRKSLKVMCREIQTAFAAATAAIESARIDVSERAERRGVILGADMLYAELDGLVDLYRNCLENGAFTFDRFGPAAQQQLFPLWLLKYLPNMSACHMSIACDARGPCNTIVSGDVSSLLAIEEGARLLVRGAADQIVTGGERLAARRSRHSSVVVISSCHIATMHRRQPVDRSIETAMAWCKEKVRPHWCWNEPTMPYDVALRFGERIVGVPQDLRRAIRPASGRSSRPSFGGAWSVPDGPPTRWTMLMQMD